MVEFSKPLKAMGILTYGESTQPGSPHIGDQLPLLSKKAAASHLENPCGTRGTSRRHENLLAWKRCYWAVTLGGCPYLARFMWE